VRKKLFGTDGIRGVAGKFPLDAPATYALGVALGDWAAHLDPHPEVLVGMDTRESGPWLAGQVAGGLARAGVGARFAGLITTPGVAHLTRTGSFVAGVMISASHNPYRDNGIKVFSHSGYKLPDEQERALEQKMFALLEAGVSAEPAALEVDEGLDQNYVDYLASTFHGSLAGLRLVIDAANGSASHLAPGLFSRLGAEVHAIGCSPNGQNINLRCGALHVEALRKEVLARQADLGVAFDGDADRAIFVARSGKIVDGDAVLLVAARYLHAAGRLGKAAVVATVMSNLGLERTLAAGGISLIRTRVGDKYVLEEMRRSGIALGGEQSGHVIFLDHATTGDGMLTALRVVEIVRQSGLGLDELTKDLQVYPQVLVNVRLKARRPLEELPAVMAEIRAAEAALGEAGRVLVRFSGTEPLARIMLEGSEQAEIERLAQRIAGVIQAALGVENIKEG
jgi:phosphoglucosamine mutase